MTPISRSLHTIARTLRRCAAPLAIAAIALSAAAPAAAEPTRFALTCIGTETGGNINFQYRWGTTGEWKTTSVAPGKWQLLRWTYDRPGQNRSPQLFIRYDDDMGDGVNMVRQPVESFAARKPDCDSDGYTYNFRERGGELFLDDEEA